MPTQVVLRRRRSASAAPPNTLATRMIGNTGPRPPPLDEPVTALTTVAIGEEPPGGESA